MTTPLFSSILPSGDTEISDSYDQDTTDGDGETTEEKP